jgi:hypothetical protein
MPLVPAPTDDNERLCVTGKGSDREAALAHADRQAAAWFGGVPYTRYVDRCEVDETNATLGEGEIDWRFRAFVTYRPVRTDEGIE